MAKLYSNIPIVSAETTLKNIILNMPGHVYWKDIHGVYLGCNDKQAQSLGFKKGTDVLGKTDFDLPWGEGVAAQFRENDLRIIKTGITEITEEPSVMDGEKVIVLSQKAPIKDKNGHIYGVLGISMDITEKKRLEAIKDEFISNMEHDLRTPLSGMGSIIDYLYSMCSEKYSELNGYFEMLNKSCKQWVKVHNRIFDVLVIGQPIKVEKFYIQDMLDEIQEMYAASIANKNLRFKLISQSRKETGQILTDSLKLHLIMMSLIGNAINFTEKGDIIVKLQHLDDYFIIDVIDTGIGVPNDKFDYIFEKFSKLSRSNKYGDKFKGLGLSLYISKTSATQLKGNISIQSTLGKGSIFTLKLPSHFN